MGHWQVGDGIELRLPEERDIDEVFDLVERNRPRLARWAHWACVGLRKEDTADWVRKARASWDDQSAFHFLIVHSAPGRSTQAIGAAGLMLVNIPAGVGEIGYWIDEAWEGKGIVTRCVAALVDEGFEKRQLGRIQIRCAPENARSKVIPRRLGFVYEGTLRRVWLVGETVHDLECYSQLRPEWEARRSSKAPGGSE